jgi:hypothetical protein
MDIGKILNYQTLSNLNLKTYEFFMETLILMKRKMESWVDEMF